jgi:hypothetical protein
MQHVFRSYFKILYLYKYTVGSTSLCVLHTLYVLCVLASLSEGGRGTGGGGDSKRARECSAQPEKKYYSKKDTISSQMMSPCKDPLQIGA